MRGLRRKPKKQFGDDNFYSHRSSSSPDLTATGQHNDTRWSTVHPHEYITVDELHFYRRKKPTEQQKSNFCLYNKSEPIISYAEFKTEYQKSYKEPPASPRSVLCRTPTSMKIDVGIMDGCSEQRSQFIAYPEEAFLRARRALIKYPENLTLSGDIELFPEYRSAFVAYNLGNLGKSVDNIMTKNDKPKPTIKTSLIDKIVQEVPEDRNGNKPNNVITERESSNKLNVKKANKYLKSILKHETESEYTGQYKNKFMDYPIGKSNSIPQISSLKFQSDITGVPEYTESFKGYNHYTKSAPIKKTDNLNVNGMMKTNSSGGYGVASEMSENKERFKEPDKYGYERSMSFRKKDTLHMKGDFTDRLPEYNEKFKNPNITSMPVRAKAKEPFLNLKGTNEFNPEYKCTYLDFPRSRPITKKPGSNIKMTNENYERFREDLQPSIRSKKIEKLRNIHEPPPIEDSENEIPYTQRPEYRKAKREMLIRERHHKHTISNDTPEESLKILNKNVIGLPIDRNNKFDANNNKTVKIISANRRKVDHNSNTESQYDDTSTSESPRRNIHHTQHPPGFKYIVENVDDVGGSFKKKTAKFGRRSSVVMDDPPPHNARYRTNIIEGNSHYIRENDEYYKQERKRQQVNEKPEAPPFVVLKEPTKQGTWMKPKWFDN